MQVTAYDDSRPGRHGAPLRRSGNASEADALLSLLDLQPGMRALEVGCGRAEFAIRLLETFPSIEATGLDTNAFALAQARARANSLGVGDRLTLIESSLAAARLAPASFDAALCVGASYVFDSFSDALRGLATCVRPGGLVLIAEGYWQHESDPGRGARADAMDRFYLDHAGIIAAAEETGLAPLYAIAAHGGGWDEHSSDYERTFERYIAAHPDDAGALTTHDHVLNLCRMYRRFGPELLGSGWYLFWRG